jgi:hypothetical protein
MTTRVLTGHVVDVLAAMEPASVHVVCTSPLGVNACRCG